MSKREFQFYKYQGCGNDFILFDNRNGDIELDTETIEKWCNRRFGIGADGLMLLGLSNTKDFSMLYYNSDGNVSSFCGNGGRCIVQFAQDLGIIKGDTTAFEFNENIYTAKLFTNNIVSLRMQDVQGIGEKDGDLFFCTGSPHYIYFAKNIDEIDLIPYARSIRYSQDFPRGINVNLVEIIAEHSLKMRTYERGVEDETYSCGTGVTAAAIALHHISNKLFPEIDVQTKGGDFKVKYNFADGKYTEVELIGKAEFVFKGMIDR